MPSVMKDCDGSPLNRLSGLFLVVSEAVENPIQLCSDILQVPVAEDLRKALRRHGHGHTGNLCVEYVHGLN